MQWSSIQLQVMVDLVEYCMVDWLLALVRVSKTCPDPGHHGSSECALRDCWVFWESGNPQHSLDIRQCAAT